MLTPEQLAKSGTEHAHQQALFAAFAAPDMRAMYPQLERLMFAIPNGGRRGSNKRDAQLNGAMMKAEGVKKGVLDIFVAAARPRRLDNGSYTVWHGLFVEMKVGTNITSLDQDKFIADAGHEGYACVVCYSWQQAYATIRAYMDGLL